jgi:hypothetical protein
MLRLALGDIALASGEYSIPGVLGHDFIALALCAAVQSKECDIASHVHVQASADLVDILTRLTTEKPA